LEQAVAEAPIHERLSREAESWLIACALPSRPPGASHGAPAPQELACVFVAAEIHGVLPALLRGTEARNAAQPNGAREALEEARARVRGYTAIGLLLAHHGERIMSALKAEDVEATVIKGPTFAKRLYPEAWLRTFTDIDVLIAPEHRAAARSVMQRLGFAPVHVEDRGTRDYAEDKWHLAGQRGVDVEIHTNLVHSPKLRQRASVGYRDVVAAGDGDAESANSLLLLAATHGAISHQFERLQNIVDVAQISAGAAGPIDIGRLRRIAEECGVGPALPAALDLAGRVFALHDAKELALAFGHASTTRVSRLLLTPRTVVRTHAPTRMLGGWRRKAFRQLMRLAARRSAPNERGDEERS
jgi:Uncharacterised nucleotidyltransferase